MISITDSETALDLKTKGVSRISLCGEEVIDTLKHEFDALHPEWDDTMRHGYYFSIYGGNQEYRKAIYATLFPILKPHIDRLFSNYKALSITAQIKGVGNRSAVALHQDLTVVDESKHRSWTLWVPLQDSTKENGPLSFLEYSQHAFSDIRTHNIDYLFENVEDYILSNSVTYLVQKGEALIFDAATIHHSAPNFSTLPRLSIALTIIEQDIEPEIFHMDRLKPFDGSLQRFSVPTDFWLRYTDFEKERQFPPKFGTENGRKFGARVLPYDRDMFISKFEEERKKAEALIND